MSFDNLCKLLAEKHPSSFATWLLGEEAIDVMVLRTELSIEPIRADTDLWSEKQLSFSKLEDVFST